MNLSFADYCELIIANPKRVGFILALAADSTLSTSDYCRLEKFAERYCHA